MYRLILAAAFVAGTGAAAQADDITDTLQSAIEAYEEGDIQYALEEIAFAQQLLNELKAGALQDFLPPAPEGWTMEIDNDNNAGFAAMGGTGVTGNYSNDTDRFTLTILTDSPMVLSMANIFGNAALLSTQGKLVRVGREKFLEQNNGELMGVIDGRIMVQANGADTDVMIPILEEIDFRKLGRFGQ